MDDIIAYAGTLLLSIGVIATFIAGKKFVLIKDIVEALNVCLKAVADGKLTKAEAKEIQKEIKDIVDFFKK
jgi:hypothetical protein